MPAHPSYRLWTSAALILAALSATGAARAETCDPRWPQIQFVHDGLQRVLKEADFAIAQDYSERVKRELKHLGEMSGRCACPAAKKHFVKAADEAHEALFAESKADLRNSIKRVLPPLDDAIKALKQCARR